MTQAEIARAAAGDVSQETLSAAMYDLKLTWSFMQNGFLDFPRNRNFPKSLDPLSNDSQPVPEDYKFPSQSIRALDIVLHETLKQLHTPSRAPFSSTQRVDEDASTPPEEVSINSSMAMSSLADMSPTSPLSPDDSFSPGSFEVKNNKEMSEDQVRYPEEEPMVWADSLLAHCETLAKQGIGRGDPTFVNNTVRLLAMDPSDGGLYADFDRAEVCLIVEYESPEITSTVSIDG